MSLIGATPKSPRFAVKLTRVVSRPGHEWFWARNFGEIVRRKGQRLPPGTWTTPHRRYAEKMADEFGGVVIEVP